MAESLPLEVRGGRPQVQLGPGPALRVPGCGEGLSDRSPSPAGRAEMTRPVAERTCKRWVTAPPLGYSVPLVGGHPLLPHRPPEMAVLSPQRERGLCLPTFS